LLIGVTVDCGELSKQSLESVVCDAFHSIVTFTMRKMLKQNECTNEPNNRTASVDVATFALGVLVDAQCFGELASAHITLVAFFILGSSCQAFFLEEHFLNPLYTYF
jgi:hypothetical protein